MSGVQIIVNPRAAARAEPYGSARSTVLNAAGFDAARREISGWPGYAPTPLRALPGLAARLELSRLWYKDERLRFGLKSFKALGGAYAVRRVLERNRSLPASAVTVTCATDGNHGRAVAWGAQLFGCRCVIFIHEGVSEGRRDAIARYGAKVVRVRGNYDDAVRHAAAEAARNGWFVVSDTSYEGYREVPLDVMHGYGVMAEEIAAQLADAAPSHVFVQVGVGALAAALCASFWLRWGAQRPRCVLVEPIVADCYFRSVAAGVPVAVHGDLATLMAGLACGEVSELAWKVLAQGADAVAALDDEWAIEAVRALANPAPGDPAVVAGETGGAGVAALLALTARADLRQGLGLGPDSRVLLIGSEGDTDPEIYRRIVGKSAEEVTAT